jgi:hypothetical protein
LSGTRNYLRTGSPHMFLRVSGLWSRPDHKGRFEVTRAKASLGSCSAPFFLAQKFGREPSDPRPSALHRSPPCDGLCLHSIYGRIIPSTAQLSARLSSNFCLMNSPAREAASLP